MLRTIALYAYGFGCVIAALLALAGINAVMSAKSAGGALGISAISMTFLPMLSLMLVVFFAQRRRRLLVPSLAVSVVAAALPLLFSLLNHGFPGIADPLATLHLAVVAVALAWGLYKLRKPHVPSAAQPSNP
jgi:hypothetical protein